MEISKKIQEIKKHISIINLKAYFNQQHIKLQVYLLILIEHNLFGQRE